MSTAAACSTFNDIHFHDVTVHQDSSLQPSRTSHHKADRVKINKDIWSVFTNLSKIETYKGRDIRPIPSYPHIKCAKKLSAQTTSPTIDNFVLLLKVTPDYYSKKHCGELNFVDRFPPSQILMIWILLLHEITIKWNGVKYNIFSVSTNDDNETTMMWLSCVIIQLFPRVLSTPIPDPILHFISKWDSDCVIEFSSLVQAQTRLLLSTSSTITIRLHSTVAPLHCTYISFTHPLTTMIVIIVMIVKLSLFYRFHLIFIKADLYLLSSPALRPARPLTMKATSQCGATLSYTQLFMQQPGRPRLCCWPGPSLINLKCAV